MRLAKLVLLPLFSFAALAPLALADVFPVGDYLVEAQPGTGIHLSTGALSGYIDFNATQQITFADVTYTDASTHVSYTFSDPSATTYTAGNHTLSATITDAANPADYFGFSILTVSDPGGVFTLSCGTDCDNFVSIPGAANDYEEFTGTLNPTPEPSSLLLLGTGALGFASIARRRLVKPQNRS